MGKEMNNTLYDQLKHNHVFSRLDNYMFQIVVKRLVFKKLLAGDYLFKEGEHGDSMAFVLVGKLDIIKNNQSGSPMLVHRIKSGDSIGEMALIDDLTRSASVQATELTALVTLSRKDFEILLEDYPRIGIAMLRGLATMLSLNLRRTSATLSKYVE